MPKIMKTLEPDIALCPYIYQECLRGNAKSCPAVVADEEKMSIKEWANKRADRASRCSAAGGKLSRAGWLGRFKMV